jgi:CBS domain-containing protein
MLDTSVSSVMKRRNMLKAAPSISVAKAAQLMTRRKVGAIMVIDDGELVGIFTERDIVSRVVAIGLDAQTTRVGDVMTMSPQTIRPDDRFGHALTIMHEKGFRHLPVIDRGKVVGIVSARSAMDPDLEEFVSEAHRREHFVREPNGRLHPSRPKRLKSVASAA